MPNLPDSKKYNRFRNINGKPEDQRFQVFLFIYKVNKQDPNLVNRKHIPTTQVKLFQ